MKIAMKLHLHVLLGLALTLAATVASAQTVIKFSHVAAIDSPKGKTAQRFKVLVEQASRGRVRVDVYPNNQLYKESDELEALQLGAVQMLAPSLVKLTQSGVREFEVFDLPYLFADDAAVARVTEGAIGRSLLNKLESKGMVGLAYWNNGFKVMSANKLLNTPSDFVGLKMRIHSSQTLDAQMEALGAVPRLLDTGEVHMALEAGLIDGTESTPASFQTRKLYEVQSNLTVSNHGYLGSAVVVNKKFWDGLPSDLRSIIDNAMRDATTYGNELAAQENAAALVLLKKNKKIKIRLLSEKETAAWHRALQPVRRDLENRIGKAVVMAVTDAAKRRPGVKR
jgi:C4-dicarboxylate-binding protein DctP